MKINDKIKRALLQAIDAAGNKNQLAKKVGVSQYNIQRWSTGVSLSISDDNWEKLYPFLKPYMSVVAKANVETETRERRIIHDLAVRIETMGKIRAGESMAQLTGYIMGVIQTKYPQTGDDKLRLILRSMFAESPTICEEMIMAEIRQLNSEIMPSEKPMPENPFGNQNSN